MFLVVETKVPQCTSVCKTTVAMNINVIIPSSSFETFVGSKPPIKIPNKSLGYKLPDTEQKVK